MIQPNPPFLSRSSTFCVIMNPSTILCWNIRGLNSRARQYSVHTLVNNSRVDVVCIQETKMQGSSQGTILFMFGSDFSYSIELPSVGASGGLLIAWRHSLGPATTTKEDNHIISIQFSLSSGLSWWLTYVYGPQGDDNKVLFLQELRNIIATFQGPWLVLGDFNLIVNDEDKNNGNFNRAMMGRFHHFINDLGC